MIGRPLQTPERFIVRDVTNDMLRLRQARRLVAENYAKLSSYNLDVETVYQELSSDTYHRRGCARTLLALAADDNGQETDLPLGTLRLILGSHHEDIPPLEVMSLMKPEIGWDDFDFADFQPHRAGEFCRLSISTFCRTAAAKRKELPSRLCRALGSAAATLAEEFGCDQIWSIMPNYVVRVTGQAGFVLQRAPKVALDFARHGDLFNRYDKYFIGHQPSLYRMWVPLN